MLRRMPGQPTHKFLRDRGMSLGGRKCVRDLHPLFRRQSYKLESGTDVCGVTPDGDRGERLLPQSEIDGNRVANIYIALNDCP